MRSASSSIIGRYASIAFGVKNGAEARRWVRWSGPSR